MPGKNRMPLARETRSVRDVLTTGQVARLCGVAPRTASQWVDSGMLPGWRLPGSKDRRVARAALVRFLRDNGVPVPQELWPAGTPLLVVSPDAALAPALAAHLPGWDVAWAAGPFAAGLLAAGRDDAAAVIDTLLGRDLAAGAAQALARRERPPALVAVTQEDDPETPGWCRRAARRPFGAEELARAVADAAEVTT